MPRLTDTEKESIDHALDFLLEILQCLDTVPDDKKTSRPEDIRAVQDTVDQLRDMNANGQIDWESAGTGTVASTDWNGIHLNPDFGNDSSNDYQLTDDFQLDNCEEGYFYSLWRIIEILVHELYHYNNHVGPWGSTKKVFICASYLLGNTLDFIAQTPLERTNSLGHEHQTYFYTNHWLFNIDSMLFAICHWGDPDCIHCCDQLRGPLRGAMERQEAYVWR